MNITGFFSGFHCLTNCPLDIWMTVSSSFSLFFITSYQIIFVSFGDSLEVQSFFLNFCCDSEGRGNRIVPYHF